MATANKKFNQWVIQNSDGHYYKSDGKTWTSNPELGSFYNYDNAVKKISLLKNESLKVVDGIEAVENYFIDKYQKTINDNIGDMISEKKI